MIIFKDRKGFTLLEMVVAVAIFVVLALLVTDIFLIATKSHRRTMEVQKLQGDARFAMEAMAREARMAEIDYEFYGGSFDIPADQKKLALRDVNNSLIVFQEEDSDKCPDEESRPCLVVGQADQWASITPAGVRLIPNTLKFYIAPTEDPFAFDAEAYEYGPDVQPRVTIVLATQSVKPPQGEVVPEVIYLQTTVTSRVYKR